jgi:hypothetical protein
MVTPGGWLRRVPRYSKAIIGENICAGFRGAGLVPHNPEAVLLKLDVKLRTPTPPSPDNTVWECKTPSNAHEIEAQSTLIRDRIRRHKSSSPASIIESLNRLERGSAKVMHDMVLMREEMASLRKAAEAATKRKSRKRRYIQSQKIPTVGEVADLIAPEEGGGQEEGKKPAKRARAERHCGRCGKTGHNSRTCKVEMVDADDSKEAE